MLRDKHSQLVNGQWLIPETIDFQARRVDEETVLFVVSESRGMRRSSEAVVVEVRGSNKAGRTRNNKTRKEQSKGREGNQRRMFGLLNFCCIQKEESKENQPNL